MNHDSDLLTPISGSQSMAGLAGICGHHCRRYDHRDRGQRYHVIFDIDVL